MNDHPMPLSAEFQEPDDAAWRALVEKVLKGRDFERALVSSTSDGIPIQPLYRHSDRPQPGPGRPGAYPYTRGAVAPESHAPWDIRQLCALSAPKSANSAILDDLEGGACSIEIRIDRAHRLAGEEPDGVCITDIADMREALSGVSTGETTLALDPGPSFVELAEMLRAIDVPSVALNADPLGSMVLGEMPVEGSVDAAIGLAREVPETWTVLRACGEVYHAAGASDAQELAAAIASGIFYLRALVDSGLSVEQTAGLIRLRLAADTDMFACIAKLRAARRLWARVLDVAGCADGKGVGDALAIEAITATRMLTRRDRGVNLLRTTCSALAAVIGGAGTVTVLPHDWAIGETGVDARRLARNIQVILREESNLHRVMDPAGGSYYVETLTARLAETAWAGVQRIEAAGGMQAALAEGSVQDEIANTFMDRLSRVAKVRDPVTGVSSFPNLGEAVLSGREMEAGEMEAKKAGENTPPGSLSETSFEPLASLLRPMRLAEGFERLRDISDARLEGTGERPRILLVNLGTLAEHGARSAYARNAFEAGGIEAVSSAALEDGSAAGPAFAKSGCRLACLCSSDECYAEMAAVAVAALRKAGAEVVYLAGRPTDALCDAGVDTFVYRGCNLLSLLEDAQSLLLGEAP